jgi:hypothetical protein
MTCWAAVFVDFLKPQWLVCTCLNGGPEAKHPDWYCYQHITIFKFMVVSYYAPQPRCLSAVCCTVKVMVLLGSACQIAEALVEVAKRVKFEPWGQAEFARRKHSVIHFSNPMLLGTLKLANRIDWELVKKLKISRNNIAYLRAASRTSRSMQSASSSSLHWSNSGVSHWKTYEKSEQIKISYFLYVYISISRFNRTGAHSLGKHFSFLSEIPLCASWITCVEEQSNLDTNISFLKSWALACCQSPWHDLQACTQLSSASQPLVLAGGAIFYIFPTSGPWTQQLLLVIFLFPPWT